MQTSHPGALSDFGAQALGRLGLSCCSMLAQQLRLWALEHRLNRCGLEAQLLCSSWNIPGSGILCVCVSVSVGKGVSGRLGAG